MEGLSKHVLLERMEEEYDSILSAAADSSISGSTSASKPVQCLGNYVPFIRHASQVSSFPRSCKLEKIYDGVIQALNRVL